MATLMDMTTQKNIVFFLTGKDFISKMFLCLIPGVQYSTKKYVKTE